MTEAHGHFDNIVSRMPRPRESMYAAQPAPQAPPAPVNTQREQAAADYLAAAYARKAEQEKKYHAQQQSIKSSHDERLKGATPAQNTPP